jgi:hypothetical protein
MDAVVWSVLLAGIGGREPMLPRDARIGIMTPPKGTTPH